MSYLFFFILLHFALATPQINLYLRDSSDEKNAIQHSCLRIATALDQWNINRQILSYCITHSLPKYYLNDHSVRFTFAQLFQANITSEQLYHWSASIDLIEDYQFYLNQISTLNDPTLEKTFFYNCTLPRFGPRCEYQLDFYHPNHTSFDDMIYNFYNTFPYEPTKFTCYKHLECDRGPSPSCLDWSEICDGKIDCSNGGIDEEHCWKLEVNECGEDEYRCMNGQCIPRSFYLDDPTTPDCLDQSDEPREQYYLDPKCNGKQPSLMCTDIACTDMPLTSSCLPQRTNLLVKALFSIKDANVSDDCWSALKCFLQAPESMDQACVNICANRNYISIIDQTCPEAVVIPAVPVLFNEIYFAYEKFDFNDLDCGKHINPYQCFNTARFPVSISPVSKKIGSNYTCILPDRPYMPSGDTINSWVYSYVIPAYLELQKYIVPSNYSSSICNRSSMYQCFNSPKCISIHRLMNNIEDCLYRDDEEILTNNDSLVIERMKQNSFYCQAKEKYIPLTAVQDGKCDCNYIDDTWCEDENLRMSYIRRNMSFQTICDGYTELVPISIDGRNESDETECGQWLCDNVYTRCNRLWNCPNGEDEIGCYQPLALPCSADQHLCVSNQTFALVCLSTDRVNDGRIDCIGGTDELNLCHRKNTLLELDNFHCITNRTTGCLKGYNLCDRQKNCIYGDDEGFCNSKISFWSMTGICGISRPLKLTDVEKFLCDYSSPKSKKQIIYFSLNQTEIVPKDQSMEFISIPIPSKSWIDPFQARNFDCHRGLNLQIRLNDQEDSTNTACLCPSSYYGEQCQYQNQRVSLSIQFRVSSDSRLVPFAILISLIDDSEQQVIQSSEQFTYLSIQDCKVKFSIYLLYSARPKDPNKTYSIQIDIFGKQSLIHRASFFMPIRFPFLPVHRLSYIIDIPSNNTDVEKCSLKQCNHGKCVRYSHSPNNNTFCRCNRGWTGRSCSIFHVCQCAVDAICVGVDANNRSVCVCPLHRFGPRCLLRHSACSTNGTCQNGGECIPNDEYAPFADKFTCICPKGYIGKRCGTRENVIHLSFETDVISTQSVFVHFIRAINNDRPQRATALRTIPFRQQSLLVHWSQPFHLVFVEFPTHNYYFTLAQTTYNRSTIIEKTIRPSDRCRHIRELFNDTVVQLHPLRRIKHYQVPCQRDAPDLMCFYDDIHLCLCQDHRRHRVANCFEFNHQMTFNCLGQSSCQNGAECFQDSADCPRRSMCVCGACFYGTQCQFSTTIFGLSLDAILGYHIQPFVGITKQPWIVQVSWAISIIFVLIGSVNGILTLITFMSKVTRNVGCGYYLFSTAIATLVITVMFGLKFWILVLTQMQVISNRSFLSFQCRLVDYFLRCALNMDRWLNACVTMERAMTMVKGARFNRGTSKRTAKWVICILIIVVIVTGLDNPIYRRLIDEENEDERRVWCVVSYPPAYQAYSTAMHIFHFIAPFLVNLISAITLIVHKSRQKSVLENDRSYNQIFREELRQHKNLLIAPVVLVILALPHLIFSFASKCMESNSNSWLFLAGYSVSFVPSMLTFVIFILPSKLYKRELRTAVTRYRRIVTRRVNSIPLRSFALN